jgi:hypothetical protein
VSTDPLLHLRDPEPPTPDLSTLARVRRRARQRQRRRLALGVTMAAVAALAASTTLAIARREADVVQVASDGAVTSTSVPPSVSTRPAPSTGFVPTGDVSRCFPEATVAVPPPSDTEVSIGGAGWPDGAPPLLALTSRGQIWVERAGGSELWTLESGPTAHRYLWARWEDAGTILASRLVETQAVVLDRLTAPGQATVVAELPYTVSDQAPAGFCPIDGYLAAFAARPEGVVLARHRPGPIPHSCPARTQAINMWACQSPQGVSFEIRGTAGIAQPGTGLGGFIGGHEPTRMVADAARSSTFAYLTGATISVHRPGAQPECCSGGQSGSSFSLRPDGDLLAYSPDGTDLRVAELTPPGAAGRSLWRAPARITATAFSSSWVAVAYGGSIALVSSDGTRHLNLASPKLDGVTSLDWAA